MTSAHRPNILWYCTDQQRWDTIRALGNSHIRTPHLDKLANNGAAFQRAYCQSPICTPSRATFLTGRYPSTHQVQRNGNDFFPSHEKLVTKILADAGYDCGLIGKLHLSRSNIVEKRPDDGYRAFYWSHHPNPDWESGHAYADWLQEEKGIDPYDLYGKLTDVYGAGVPTDLHQTTWCTEMAIRFIHEERNSPWLLSINPFDPHPPFDPPQEYLDRYRPEDMPYPLFEQSDIEHQKLFQAIDQQAVEAKDPYAPPPDTLMSTEEVSREDMGSVPPPHYDIRKIKACYYAMIELIDNQFGRILESLQQTGQLDNTIIIYMSDHGELLGDHGLIYKGCRFFDGLVRVPLIISWPGHFQAGLHSDALVELVDLPPTLLEAAGLDIPENMQGTSLYPLLTGQGDPHVHKSHVICEYYDAIGGLPDHSHGTMYFDGRYKMCVYHGHDIGELYDLQQDPGEFRNLWLDPAAESLKLEILKNHFDAMMATNSAGIPRSGNY